MSSPTYVGCGTRGFSLTKFPHLNYSLPLYIKTRLRLTDLGKYLGLNHPYHGGMEIFRSQKPNNYLKKMLEIERETSKKIEELEEIVNEVNKFKSALAGAESDIALSLNAVKNIKML